MREGNRMIDLGSVQARGWIYKLAFSSLFTAGAASPKLAKQSERVLALIMYLAPHTLADGVRTLCANATAGCIAVCITVTGRGQVTGGVTRRVLHRYALHRARIARSRFYLRDRAGFLARMHRDVGALVKRARKAGALPVVRPNGTSDVPWESRSHWGPWGEGGELVSLFDAWPTVQWYDYTKSRIRALRYARGFMPANYHLTYSHTENDTPEGCAAMVGAGCNVAVVFGGGVMPAEFAGVPVFDASAYDWRFRDPVGVAGLYAIGRAGADESGFVVREGDPGWPVGAPRLA
jgi:hypothetical protein